MSTDTNEIDTTGEEVNWYRFVQQVQFEFDMSAVELARAVGVHPNQVSRWAKGQGVDVATLREFNRRFDIPMPRLLVAAGIVSQAELDPNRPKTCTWYTHLRDDYREFLFRRAELEILTETVDFLLGKMIDRATKRIANQRSNQ